MDKREQTPENLKGSLSSGQPYPGKEVERAAACTHVSRKFSKKSGVSSDQNFVRLDVEFTEPE